MGATLSEASPADLKRIAKKDLKGVLAKVRKQGFECMDSEITYGVKDIGFPVYDFDNQVVAALTCPFLQRIDGSNPVDLDEATKLIGASAKAISQGLGHLGSH